MSCFSICGCLIAGIAVSAHGHTRYEMLSCLMLIGDRRWSVQIVRLGMTPDVLFHFRFDQIQLLSDRFFSLATVLVVFSLLSVTSAY